MFTAAELDFLRSQRIGLSREARAAMVVDAMGPRRGVAMQGRVELIAPERARLEPVRKFAWGL